MWLRAEPTWPTSVRGSVSRAGTRTGTSTSPVSSWSSLPRCGPRRRPGAAGAGSGARRRGRPRRPAALPARATSVMVTRQAVNRRGHRCQRQAGDRDVTVGLAHRDHPVRAEAREAHRPRVAVRRQRQQAGPRHGRGHLDGAARSRRARPPGPPDRRGSGRPASRPPGRERADRGCRPAAVRSGCAAGRPARCPVPDSSPSGATPPPAGRPAGARGSECRATTVTPPTTRQTAVSTATRASDQPRPQRPAADRAHPHPVAQATLRGQEAGFRM